MGSRGVSRSNSFEGLATSISLTNLASIARNQDSWNPPAQEKKPAEKKNSLGTQKSEEDFMIVVCLFGLVWFVFGQKNVEEKMLFF